MKSSKSHALRSKVKGSGLKRARGMLLYLLATAIVLSSATVQAGAQEPEMATVQSKVATGGGQEANRRLLQHFAQARPTPSTCQPDSRKDDQISAALTKRAKGVHSSCATPARPARFKIGDGGTDLAIIVRPTTGDLDAFLMKGTKIIDASLNAKQRPEVLLLPSERDLEVVVVANASVTGFEISVTNVPTASVRPQRQSTPASVPANVQSDPSDDPQAAPALGVLGFDLLGPADAEPDSGIVHRRAIMAFQVAEKFPVTGKLLATQLNRLVQSAALQIDRDAVNAVAVARDVAARSVEIQFQDENGALRSIKSGVRNGRVFGVGELQFGGLFEGEWLDSAEANSGQRPFLGSPPAGGQMHHQPAQHGGGIRYHAIGLAQQVVGDA